MFCIIAYSLLIYFKIHFELKLAGLFVSSFVFETFCLLIDLKGRVWKSNLKVPKLTIEGYMQIS